MSSLLRRSAHQIRIIRACTTRRLRFKNPCSGFFRCLGFASRGCFCATFCSLGFAVRKQVLISLLGFWRFVPLALRFKNCIRNFFHSGGVLTRTAFHSLSLVSALPKSAIAVIRYVSAPFGTPLRFALRKSAFNVKSQNCRSNTLVTAALHSLSLVSACANPLNGVVALTGLRLRLITLFNPVS